MLTLQIKDNTLEKKIADLLQHQFNGDPEKMLQELLKSYSTQIERLHYSGILTWQEDGLAFQKGVRGEW